MGRTVGELKESLDINELNDWYLYFEMENNMMTKQDAYLAQIAMVNECVMSGRSRTINDFKINFGEKPMRSKEDLARDFMARFGGK